MLKATYQKTRKLCSGLFSRKQTLQFASVMTPSCDVSTQQLCVTDSTSLCIQTCETPNSLWPLSIDKMNADYFNLLSHFKLLLSYFTTPKISFNTSIVFYDCKETKNCS